MRTNLRTPCRLFLLVTLLTVNTGERSYAQVAKLPTKWTKASMESGLPFPEYPRPHYEPTKAVLTDRYILLTDQMEQLRKFKNLSLDVYTQTTDIEHEVNGLITYDSAYEKMEVERIKEVNHAVISESKKYKISYLHYSQLQFWTYCIEIGGLNRRHALTCIFRENFTAIPGK